MAQVLLKELHVLIPFMSTEEVDNIFEAIVDCHMGNFEDKLEMKSILQIMYQLCNC